MISKYLSFLAKSTNQHGVHSPFVYGLVTSCIYKKSSPSVEDKLKIFFKRIKQNHTEIRITDFGAGSKYFKNNKRKVSALARKVGISKKYALLLNRLVSHLEVNQALELGTSIGLATMAMCIENKKIKIDTVEGCSEITKVATSQFEHYQIKDQVIVYNENIKNILPVLTSTKKYDLVYVDANHQKEATLDYFEQCLQAKHNDSVFIFDDINWSEAMQETWETIKSHSEVKVTIDLFRWGLVFFRKEQNKEHFKIRF